MESRFDILFSIKINHEAFTGAQAREQVERSFALVPTDDCRRKLSKLGLLLKNTEGGILVISDKKKAPNGSFSPLRTMTELTDFVFLLKTKDANLLSSTRPFETRPNLLLSGRPVFYFSNQSSTNQLDLDNELTEQDFVSREDWITVMSHQFSQIFDPSVSNRVIIEEYKPDGNRIETFSPNPRNKQLIIKNLDGIYLLRNTGSSNRTERFFASDTLLKQETLGIIQIFKTENTDYDVPKNYTINFQKIV
jgi:hypothetical protein